MRIIDEYTKQEITNPDLTAGYLYDAKIAPADAYASIDGINKFALEDADYEQVQMYHLWTDDEKRTDSQSADREKLLLTLSECFTETLIPSDKQGFLFKVVKLGDVEILREYVTDPSYDPDAEDGSYLKPFKYTAGMECIQGMWYWLDDKQLPNECIKSGVPAGFDDAEYFDIIA